MNVLAKSWSAPSDARRLASPSSSPPSTVLHWGFYQHNLILDTVEYHRYGNAMLHGHVPYRDFGVEYPPGALPVFAAPAIGHDGFSLAPEPQVLTALALWPRAL